MYMNKVFPQVAEILEIHNLNLIGISINSKHQRLNIINAQLLVQVFIIQHQNFIYSAMYSR